MRSARPCLGRGATGCEEVEDDEDDDDDGADEDGDAAVDEGGVDDGDVSCPFCAFWAIFERRVPSSNGNMWCVLTRGVILTTSCSVSDSVWRSP